MSSSNLVRVTALPEVTYGITPPTGAFKTARFISEALSGTPGTVVSQQIRTDRMSSGQVVTGLTVGGELSFELAKEEQLELFMESAMCSTWDVKALTTVDLTLDAIVAAVYASRIFQDLTYTSLIPGVAGNGITVAYIDDAVAGAETVSVVGTVITVHMDSAASTATQVRTAVLANIDAAAIVNVTVSGTGSNAQNAFSVLPLQSGADATYPRTLTRATGNWASDGYVVGDYIKLGGFLAAGNNVYIMIAEIVDADTIRYVGPEGMSDEAGSGTSVQRADKLTIGTQKKSFSMEKKFLDLTNKGINYKGMLVSQMDLNVGFGELISGSFTFSGNNYQAWNSAASALTYNRTVTAPATTDTLNGSVDMPFLASSDGGTFDSAQIDIQSVGLSLNNNTSAQNAIGNVAPRGYSLGTANIEISISCYLKDEAWGLLAKKLSQASFALSYSVRNTGGGYAFYIPAVQVSFDDPASGGQNQDISLEMTGQAKVGPNGISAMTIYRLVA